MRLLHLVKRLEGRAPAEAAEPGGGGWCVVWSSHESRVDASAVGAGEYIAADVWLGPVEQGARIGKIYERVTGDAQDLGAVYALLDDGACGPRIGRVIRTDGERVDFELTGELAGPAAPGVGLAGD